MNLNRDRMKVIPIDLSVAQVTPRKVSIAGAKCVAFLRYEHADGVSTPELFNGNWFQIEIDQNNIWIPFKPYDRFSVMDPADEFVDLRFVNKRAMPAGTWAFIYIFTDMGYDPGPRLDVPHELRNIFTTDDYVGVSQSSPVTVAGGGFTSVLSLSVPTSTKLILWGFNVEQIPTNKVDWQAHLVWRGTSTRRYGRLGSAFAGFYTLAVEYPKPLEFLNDTISNQTFAIFVRNDSLGAEDFWGSFGYALAPTFINYQLPGEVESTL